VVQLSGNGSLNLVSTLGEISNLSNDSVVTSLEDDTCSTSTGAHGAEEGNIVTLEDVLWLLFWDSGELLRLTCEGRVVDLHLISLDDDHVSWNIVSEIDLNNVSGYQLACIHEILLPVPPDKSLGRDEVLEASHDGAGLALLLEVEDSSEQDDEDKHHCQVKIRLVSFVRLNTKHNETEHWPNDDHIVEQSSHGEQEPNNAR
jgi:hypothetical protein